MRRIFWSFCRNWFLIDPLHYLSSRSDFGFEFAEIFVIEKGLPDSYFRFKCMNDPRTCLPYDEEGAEPGLELVRHLGAAPLRVLQTWLPLDLLS